MLLHFAPDTGQLQTKSCCQERLMDCLMSPGPDKPGPGPPCWHWPGITGRRGERARDAVCIIVWSEGEPFIIIRMPKYPLALTLMSHEGSHLLHLVTPSYWKLIRKRAMYIQHTVFSLVSSQKTKRYPLTPFNIVLNLWPIPLNLILSQGLEWLWNILSWSHLFNGNL